MEIRALTMDEFAATRDLRRQAFGPMSDTEWEQRLAWVRPLVGAGRCLGGFSGGRVVATAHVNDQRQWWRGRAVPLGGVSGVAVAPDLRGRGLGRAVVRAALDRCAGLGLPLSMLYPATSPLYRSLGWEHAGGTHEVRLDPAALRSLGPTTGVPVRPAGPDDAARVAAVVAGVHEAAGDCGPVAWTEERWRTLLAQPGQDSYLAEDGFLSYRWGEPGELVVAKAVAGSPETLRTLWAVVGSGSSTADRVTAVVGPRDPVLWSVPERLTDRVRRLRWMLRVVDVRAALHGRGYPAAVAAQVPFRLEDPQFPENSGSYRLAVAGGAGVLEPAPDAAADAVRLGPRGLAALYAGVPAATLRRAGLAGGGAAHDDALDAVFAADAFALDFF